MSSHFGAAVSCLYGTDAVRAVGNSSKRFLETESESRERRSLIFFFVGASIFVLLQEIAMLIELLRVTRQYA